MRFAMKTRPEHQTWEEIRDAWIAADEIPLFESAWNWDHFYPLRERFDRFDEGVEAIVGLLSQTTTTFAGRYVRLTDARCEPKPVQRPHPPITIGGRGKQRTLRTVARFAQQWNAIAQSAEDWFELKEVLAGHCAAIGRDVNEITCSVNVRIDGDGGLEAAVAAATAYRDAGVDLIIVNLPLHAKPDSLQPLAEALAPLA